MTARQTRGPEGEPMITFPVRRTLEVRELSVGHQILWRRGAYGPCNYTPYAYRARVEVHTDFGPVIRRCDHKHRKSTRADECARKMAIDLFDVTIPTLEDT